MSTTTETDLALFLKTASKTCLHGRWPNAGPKQRTPAWYALREQTDPPIFGASDAAAICGMSRRRMARDVYEDRIRPQRIEPTPAMLAGICLEPGVLKLYGLTEGCRVADDQPVYFHPHNPVLAASLDGYRCDDYRPVEAKCSMSPQVAEQLGEEGSDWVPTDWLMQVQQQMDVMGRDCADIAVLLYGRLHTYTVARQDELIAAIHEAAEEMRERIENQDPPEINYQHTGALETLKRAYPEIAGEGIVLDTSASDAACRYIDLGKQISELQKARDVCKATVLDSMGEAPRAKVSHLDVEFRRIQIKGGKPISYTSKPYVRLTHGKPKT